MIMMAPVTECRWKKEDRDDGSGDRTEEGAVAKSGEVYILVKPVLTS